MHENVLFTTRELPSVAIASFYVVLTWRGTVVRFNILQNMIFIGGQHLDSWRTGYLNTGYQYFGVG